MSPEARIALLETEFSAGQYDWLTAGYCYPLPIYLGDGLLVAATSDDAVGYLRTLHALLRCNGPGVIKGHLAPVKAPLDNRFQIKTTWTWCGSQGSLPVMRTNWFNRGTWAEHRTEMVQIRLHCAGLAARLQAAA